MADVLRALTVLLDEIAGGSRPDAGWILNPHDQGLLRSLDGLSAAEASALPPSGGASVAAHVDHLRYGLSLLNRWAAGESGVFEQADYAASWRRTSVSEAAWSSLRQELRAEIERWRAALQTPRDPSDVELTGMLASVAHLAYHLGAVRQIRRSLGGPPAGD